MIQEIVEHTLLRVSEELKIHSRAILSKQRRYKVIIARDVYAYIVCEYTKLNKDKLAPIMDRHRTALAYSYNKIANVIGEEDDNLYIGPYRYGKIKNVVDEILKELKFEHGKNYNNALRSGSFATYYWDGDGPEEGRIEDIALMLSKFSRKKAPQKRD